MIDVRRRAQVRLSLLALLFATGCGGGSTPDAAPERVGEGPVPSVATADTAAFSRVILTEASATAAGVRTEPARRADGAASGMLVEAPGQVVADPSRTAFVSARAGGRLERLVAVAGDRVAAGQVVALVQSPSFLTAQHDFAQAGRRARLLVGTPDSLGAIALASAARQRLLLFGITEADLARLAGGGEPAALLPVTAPFEGSLVEGMMLAGAAVEAGTPIFRMIDLREVDIAADVPERFLPDLRVGQRATVFLAAYPDLQLDGRVERIRDELDPTTRTIEALVHVRNPGRNLRPGMFARVQLQVSAVPASRATQGEAALVLPAAAVVSDVEQRYVFVEVAPYTYERRVVELAPNDARFGGVGTGEVVVHGGVRPGERVVVAGAFTLKSELAKAGFAEE